MRKSTMLVIAVVCFSFAGLHAAYAGEHPPGPYPGSKEFERMKQLVGAWEGTADMGKEGEKLRVEYRLTAGKSALVETISPGTPEEMVSVYHDRKGKLAMTHYCMLHNQPRMTLKKADARTLDLVFAKDNDINPAKETHMHALSIAFEDDDHIVQKWTTFEQGKAKGVVTLNLTRVR
jgi:hypothetical protein